MLPFLSRTTLTRFSLRFVVAMMPGRSTRTRVPVCLSALMEHSASARGRPTKSTRAGGLEEHPKERRLDMVLSFQISVVLLR